MTIRNDTDKPTLEKRSYSAALSLTGATSRIIRAVSRIEPRWLSITTLVATILLAIPVVWSFIIVWYVVVFGLFGLIVIPWRLHRRSQRKAQHLAEAQLALFQRATGGVPEVTK